MRDVRARFGFGVALAVASLALWGCAPSPDTAVPGGDTGGAAGELETPPANPPSGKTLSGPSDYADCPGDVAAGFSSSSNVEWRLLDLAEVWVPEGVDVPVPSCAVANPDGDWVELVYMGAGPELIELLAPQLLANGYVVDKEGVEWSSYRAADDSLVNFEYAPSVSPAHQRSNALGAPFVLVGLMGGG